MRSADVQPSLLVARLMQTYGATSYEQLARILDVPLRSVQRWATDDASPSFATTIDLLERAGWLSRDGAELAPRSAPDRLAELEATVEVQGKATTTALKALTAGIRKLERQIEAAAPPARKRAAR